MTKFLNQEERVWLLKKVTNATPQTPIGLLRRQYYQSYSGVLETGEIASQLSLGELEWRWMTNYITDNGGTIDDDNDNYSDLWKKMVMVIGQIPTNNINQNMLIFYGNAA